MLKHFMTLALVLMLALTGVITVSANGETPERSLSHQQSDQPTAWLGVSIVETENGVMITQVAPDSPADEAGLRHGDIVIAVDETKIDSAQLLVDTIRGYAPGDAVELTFTRGNETQTVTVTLAERPAEIADVPFGFGTAGEPGVIMLGVLGLNLEVTDEGMVVQAVKPDSPFADADLQAGDLITAVNGDPVGSDLAPMAIMSHMRFNEPIVFTVVRDGEEMEIEVQFDETDLNTFPFEQIQPVPAARPTQLGVQFQTLTADVAEERDLDVKQGALIVEVFEDTPAAAAGLQVDDIIQAVNGDVVDEERTLADRLYAYEEGDVVTLTVLRAGEEMEIEVELGPRSDAMRFGGPVQIMPVYPGQRKGGKKPIRPHRGCWDMMPHDGMFPFGEDFFENHPFWGQGGDSMDEAPDTDSGTSM